MILKQLFQRRWSPATKLILLLILALAVFLLSLNYLQSKLADQRLTVPVLVAKMDIFPFQELNESNTEIQQRVKSDIPSDVLTDVSQLDTGQNFASAVGFVEGSMIRQNHLTTASQSQKGSSIALRQGEYQVGVKVDLPTSAGGEVRAGTKVDVVAYVGHDNQGTVRSDPVLSGIEVQKVLDSQGDIIDSVGADASVMVPSVVVLRVNEEQRNLIVKYQESGKVYLTPTKPKNN